MISDFSRPAPYVYGCQYCENLIKNGFGNSNPSSLSDQIIAVIKNTDINIIIFALKILFQKLESKTDDAKQIQIVIDNIIKHFQEQTQFKNIIAHYFNRLEFFPVSLLDLLTFHSQFVLSLLASESIYSEEAKKYLTEKILPNLSSTENIDYLPNELIYQLFSLDLPGLDKSKFINSLMSPALSLYTRQISLNEPSRLEPTQITVPIYSVVMEYDSNFLSSPTHVEQLFDFYPDFNEKHAATFVLSLFVQDSNFKDYLDKLDNHQRTNLFNMYKEIFINRKISFTKLVDSLDIKDFPAIPSDSCSLLFSCLGCFFEKQLISSSSFTRRWRNKDLQFSILSSMTNIFIPNLDFSKSGPQINIHQFDLPMNAFRQCNNCWESLDFTERFVSLMINNEPALEQYLDPLINKYPALLIALLGQTKIRITDELINAIIGPLIKVLQGPQSILSVLWKLAEPFMNIIISELYQRQPARLELIYESAGKQMQTLLMHEDVRLATDLAFYAVGQNKLEIGEFISNYTTKYTISSLSKIMDFIKTRITEALPSAPPFQTSVLNQLFAYLYENFDNYPIETKAFIKRTFFTCETFRPDLKINHFTFDLKIPASKMQEIKQTASMNYSMLLEDDLTVSDLEDMIERYRTTDPTLFSCHIHYLLKEFANLSKHIQSDVEKLAVLTGHLVSSNVLSSKQIEIIFSFTKKSLSQPPNTCDFIFAVTMIESCLSRLSDFPNFVFDIIHESQLRLYRPSLFDKIQRIGQAFNEPLQSNRSTVLNIHPLLRHYEQITLPPPRVCKAVQGVRSDPKILPTLLQNYPQYKDWIAFHITCIIQDTPELLNSLLTPLLEARHFLKYVFQASAAQVHQHVLSPDFDKFEGGFVRRRLLILGKLIGQITLAVNRPIIARFLDLKKILLYAFSQGKLYGVVPFVCAILMPCSKYFSLPNPYTSSILQILAAIYSIDNIKFVIKQSIEDIFIRFNTSLSRFASIPMIFPDKKQGNFDFLMTPFSLQHAVGPQDVERIINFDETAFAQLVSQLIIIPDSPILTTKPELKDKMRRALMQQSLHLIRQEGVLNSRIASSTATALAMKDFLLYSDNDLLIEQAQTLTKQLANGLTWFKVPFSISRQLLLNLKHEAGGADIEWVESIAQQNFDWIVQLLRDIVRIKAWKVVQKAVEHSDEERLKMQKNAKSLQTYSLQQKQAFYIQMQQVYLDMSELQINLQPYPISESIQSKERLKIDPEFDEYLQKFIKSQYLGSLEAEDTNAVLAKCPDLSGKTVSLERFQSILKTLMKFASKTSQNDQLIARILDKVCQSVPHSLITKSQSYIISWIKNSMHGFLIIEEILNVGLMTIHQLDNILTDMLNNVPFNIWNVSFATQLLHFLLVRQNHVISPASVISTLSALSVCKTCLQSDNLQNQSQQFMHLMKQFDELIQIYNSMEAPIHQLSASSKLQMVSTFDPVEEMNDSENIILKMQQWAEIIDLQNPKSQKLKNSPLNSPSKENSEKESSERDNGYENDNDNNNSSIDENIPGEAELLKATVECANIGKDFFVYLFFNECQITSLQFLKCIEKSGELKNHWNEMLEAIIFIIQGNGNVVGFDYRKFYSVFRAMMDLAIEENNANANNANSSNANSSNGVLIQYVVALHKCRPLLMPSFTFPWIELITDKHLVYSMLSNSSNWASYAVLLTDYASVVSQIDTDNSNLGNISYSISLTPTSSSTSLSTSPLNPSSNSSNSSSSSQSDVFMQLYKSFLRFLLILIHDFKDFIVAAQPLLFMTLPFGFYQARNIILSATPKDNVEITPLLSVDDLLSYLPGSFVTSMKHLVDNFNVNNSSIVDEENNNGSVSSDEMNSLKVVIDQISPQNNFLSLRAFIAYLTAPLSNLKQSDPIEETTAFNLISVILDIAQPEIVLAIVNLLVDKLRSDSSRETNAFIRLIAGLLKLKVNRSGIGEVIARVIFERASAPPPHPSGLISIIKELTNERNNILMELPLSSQNKSVTAFLNAARTAFQSRK